MEVTVDTKAAAGDHTKLGRETCQRERGGTWQRARRGDAREREEAPTRMGAARSRSISASPRRCGRKWGHCIYPSPEAFCAATVFLYIYFKYFSNPLKIALVLQT
jgi:hypothetical protein